MTSTDRLLTLVDLLGLVVAVRPGERALVGIDGPDGVGKTRLSEELRTLAPRLSAREVHGVSVDGFHHPRAVRYAHGRDAEGYYRHAFDLDAFRSRVVDPFRAGREVVPAVHDVATDEALDPDPLDPADDAVLLVDGVFLRRPELEGVFDAVLLLTAPAEVTVPRGNARFDLPAERDHPGHPGNARCVGAQALYAYEVEQAWALPTWVLDSTDLDRPVLADVDPEEPVWA